MKGLKWADWWRGALPRWGLVKSVEPQADHWVTKANANEDPCDFIDSKDVEIARLSIYYVSHQACVKKTFPTAESKPLSSPAQTVLISARLLLWGWKRKRLHKHIKTPFNARLWDHSNIHASKETTGGQQRTQTHPGLSRVVPHARTRDISPLKDASMSKCTAAQRRCGTAICWVSLCIKREVCVKVKLVVMLTDKVFSWDALGLESVHSLEARCSHVVIIIPWLFGKTGLASGTFIYIHGKTREHVCWHSRWKQTNKMLAARRKPGENAAFLKLSISQMLTGSASSEPLRTLRLMLDPFCAPLQKHSRRGAKRTRNIRLL